MTACPSCGASVDESAKFCTSCGARLSHDLPVAAEPRTPAGRRAKPPFLARLARTLWPKSGVSMRRELFLVILYGVVLVLLFTRFIAR